MKRIFIGCVVAGLFTLRIYAADDFGCQPVLDALAKLGDTPNHQYIVVTNSGTGGGIRESETICSGDVAYIKANGKWTIGPLTPQESARQQQENIRTAKVYNCKHERDEKLDGDTVSVYKAHSENEDGMEDAEIWISKSRGLILRETVESTAGEMHMSVRFVYTNVRAPQVQ